MLKLHSLCIPYVQFACSFEVACGHRNRINTDMSLEAAYEQLIHRRRMFIEFSACKSFLHLPIETRSYRRVNCLQPIDRVLLYNIYAHAAPHTYGLPPNIFNGTQIERVRIRELPGTSNNTSADAYFSLFHRNPSRNVYIRTYNIRELRA